MKKALLLIVLLLTITPIYASAQQAGAFVGSLGLGLPSAQGDFSDPKFLAAGSGFGFEGEVRYYLFNGFGIGVMGNWLRFGTTISSATGRLSYNFSQLGGTARLNLISLSDGAIFINGGGGTFKPNAHYYVPDHSIDITSPNRGYFGFAGIGLTSSPYLKTLYELEIRYNMGRADITSADYGLPGNMSTNAWDFLYVGVKLSFASKGKDAPPKY